MLDVFLALNEHLVNLFLDSDEDLNLNYHDRCENCLTKMSKYLS